MIDPTPEYWDEPILARDAPSAERQCKDKAKHYSSPGHQVESLGAQHKGKFASKRQYNFDCKFKTTHEDTVDD